MAFRAAPRLAGGVTYLWVSARARNALRRIAVLGGIAGGVFVVAIIAFVLVPRRASRSAHAVAATIEAKEDSSAAVNARESYRRRIIAADSLLAAARRVSHPVVLPIDTFPFAIIARRESLSVAISKLGALIQRAEDTPLASSYRALASSPLVAGEPQIPQLLDSLVAVERDRAAYGSIGAIDPGYAALSSRASNIGRSITGVAAQKRDRLRAELNSIRPAPQPAQPTTAFVDTLRYLTDRAVASTGMQSANAEIAKVRAQNLRVDAQLDHARDLANLGAPPWAMLAAALVLAAALGFAGSLAVELRRPHVADAREAEQVSGERVLTVIGPAATVVERGRRQTDVGAPPLIDVVSEAYRTLYLHIASVGAGLPVVTVTGDEPEIVGTVSSNLAASAAYEARSALLVDVDATTCSVAAVLRVAPDPGLSGVLSGTATWSEAIKPTTIGRDRPLDVLPSGSKRAGMLEPHVTEAAKDEFLRLQKRYDFIIIAAPTSYVQRTATSVIPSPEVLLTARVGHTKLSTLKSAAESLRGTNMKIQGIILWDAPFPHLENKDELVNATRRGAQRAE
jgi:Mrp family chromosome partitioning ATPase